MLTHFLPPHSALVWQKMMVDGKTPQVEFTGVEQSRAWPPAVSPPLPSASPGAGSQAVRERVWVQPEVDE